MLNGAVDGTFKLLRVALFFGVIGLIIFMLRIAGAKILRALKGE